MKKQLNEIIMDVKYNESFVMPLTDKLVLNFFKVLMKELLFH